MESVKFPFQTMFADGDIESLLFTDKHKSVFISIPSFVEPGDPNIFVIRMMLDAEILPVPKVGGHINNLHIYFDNLPKRGVLYAMRNGYRVNYGLQDLKRDWGIIFKKNSMYRHLAKTRYKTPRQALLELHNSAERGNKFFQRLQMALYGKVTAFTEEATARQLLGAAVVKRYQKVFRGPQPICTIY